MPCIVKSSFICGHKCCSYCMIGKLAVCEHRCDCDSIKAECPYYVKNQELFEKLKAGEAAHEV